MATYYYLASTLPLLYPDREAPYTIDAFVSLALPLLSGSDVKSLALVHEQGLEDSGIEVVQQYYRFSEGLSALLAGQRAAELGWEQKPETQGQSFINGEISRIVHSALSASSPLEAERLLDGAKFAFLEQLEAGHYFDFTSLVIYYLKLTILEREARFEQAAGEQEFRRLLKSIQTSITSY